MYPDIWFELGSYIHQDFLLQFTDFKSGILDFCSDLSADQIDELYAFVQGVINANYSGDQLAEVWEGSGAQILFHPQSSEAAFEVMQAALRQCRKDAT